jgi:dipeptidyl aminopeptidase/acylaminoacyl peptidase
MLRSLFAALAVLAVFAAPRAVAQQLTAAQFARPATVWSASLSPDGRFVAAIQAVDQGEALVIIDWRSRQAQAIQVARRDRSLFLETVDWKDDTRLIFRLRQRATMQYETTGTRRRIAESEEFDVIRLFAINRDGSNMVQLFQSNSNQLAFRDAPVRLIDSLPHDPGHVLLGTWGQRGFTLYRANVNSGRTEALEDAAWETFRLIVDNTGRPVIRMDSLPYGSGWRIFRRGPSESRWTLAHEFRGTATSQNRDFAPIVAGPNPGQVYVAARPQGQEYQAIYLYDTATGQLGAPVFASEGADAGIASINLSDGSMLVACAERQRLECRAADPGMQRHFDALSRYFENAADFSLNSTSRDGQLWLIAAFGPTIPTTYYIYDVATTQVTPVAPSYPHIPRAGLAPTRVVNYTARDGTALWGYLTTPASAGPHSTVIMPHGGPRSRDSFGYDFFVQFLVSRGYAVFQPNFRGSEGSGRSFAQAGFRQWGRLMQDDVTDGVRHLINTGVSDSARICIVGFSYGGYAALAGVTLTPDLYRCAVSIAGVSDMLDQIDSWRSDGGRRSALYAQVVEQLGDPDRDREALIAVSPRRQVEAITAPVLLIHGELDDIVPPLHSERMRDALQRAGKTVRYVEIERVYHPWDGWTNRETQTLLEETERFLAQHIGAP